VSDDINMYIVNGYPKLYRNLS